jgi:SEC-C motif domain protein
VKSAKSALNCYCESGKTYDNCCGLYHAGQIALTAEALMRSRYSAYVLRLEAYLLATWHPDTRPARLDLTDSDRYMVWLGLSVKSSQKISETEAKVRFVACYKDLENAGKAERLEEHSVFYRIKNQWFYYQAL